MCKINQDSEKGAKQHQTNLVNRFNAIWLNHKHKTRKSYEKLINLERPKQNTIY